MSPAETGEPSHHPSSADNCCRDAPLGWFSKVGSCVISGFMRQQIIISVYGCEPSEDNIFNPPALCYPVTCTRSCAGATVLVPRWAESVTGFNEKTCVLLNERAPAARPRES